MEFIKGRWIGFKASRMGSKRGVTAWRMKKAVTITVRITSYNVCYTKLLRGFTGVMMRRRTMWGVLTVGPMLEPDQVRPVGETEEEQRENFERYALGVREAMRIERAQLQQDQILTELARNNFV